MKRLAQTQAGFSLIEVLITVFVVAVGLLSVAGMQTQSKKASYDAVQRTFAATLSQDIIERMRANVASLPAYTGQTITAAQSPPSPLCSSTSASTAACSTSAQIAAYDLFQWSVALSGSAEQDSTGTSVGGLTAATGCTFAGATTGAVSVAIAWRGVTPLAIANPDTSQEAQCGVSNPANPAYDLVPNSGDGLLRRVLIVRTFVDVVGATR